MNKDGLAAYMLGMIMNINSEYNMFSGLTFDEMLMAMDEKIMDITLGLTFEIRELIDEGYSYEEIYNLIQDIKFKEDINISESEAEYIKKDAHKTLKLIMDNKEKENDIYE